MAHVTEAAVFVLSRYLMPDAARCIGYAVARGYHVVGIIKDDWSAAIAMLVQGKVSVIVAADPRRLDPDRSPRVEYVAHVGPTGRPKTQIIQRTEEA